MATKNFLILNSFITIGVPFQVFYEIIKSSSSTFIFDSSMVSPFALLFFGKYVLWSKDTEETKWAIKLS